MGLMNGTGLSDSCRVFYGVYFGLVALAIGLKIAGCLNDGSKGAQPTYTPNQGTLYAWGAALTGAVGGVGIGAVGFLSTGDMNAGWIALGCGLSAIFLGLCFWGSGRLAASDK